MIIQFNDPIPHLANYLKIFSYFSTIRYGYERTCFE